MRIKLILLVAESAATADALGRSLEDVDGVQIAWYPNGQSARRLVRAIRPALIVLDLPFAEARPLCPELRAQLAEGRLVPILAAAQNDVEDRALREAGAAGVLRRPFDDATLAAMVRRWLEPGRNGPGQ